MRARRVSVPSLLDDPGVRRAQSPGRRFLFAVPPFGDLAPATAVAAELVRRGDKVAWTGHRATLEPKLRPGSRVFDAVEADAGERLDRVRSDGRDLRGVAAVRLLWEDLLVPLGHAMAPGVEKAIERFRPHVVVADQLALAAPVAARRRDLPWATVAATSAEFSRPLAALPKVEQWVRDRIAGFLLDHGVDDLFDPRFSERLVLVFTAAGLIGDVTVFPGHVAFVGPVAGRAAPRPFPWERLDGRPAVLVTPGAAAGTSGDRFLRAAAEAVRDLDVQAVVETHPGVLPDPPPNVLVVDRVPHHRLMERLSAVVCHGAHDTVCAALSHGLPLVVAPVRDDQPAIARQVEAAGAGLTVRCARPRPDELRTALTTVLNEDAYRAAAGRIRDSINASGGVAEAADRLEKLA
ncbi:MAG TPA: nucleotide disphospho-sugar-binding domain-containing protein [Spirillospora sp.]